MTIDFLQEYPENAELSTLFHVRSLPVNASDGYNCMCYYCLQVLQISIQRSFRYFEHLCKDIHFSALILSALSAAFAVFPSAEAVAVIEEDIILSPDWLYYLSQTLPVLLSDVSIDVIHTFNPNGG